MFEILEHLSYTIRYLLILHTEPFTLFFTPLLTRSHLQVNELYIQVNYLVNYCLLKTVEYS